MVCAIPLPSLPLPFPPLSLFSLHSVCSTSSSHPFFCHIIQKFGRAAILPRQIACTSLHYLNRNRISSPLHIFMVKSIENLAHWDTTQLCPRRLSPVAAMQSRATHLPRERERHLDPGGENTSGGNMTAETARGFSGKARQNDLAFTRALLRVENARDDSSCRRVKLK